MKGHFDQSTVLRVGVLALTLMFPFSVHAAAPKAPAKATTVQSPIAEVNRLYEDLEYEQALEQIQRARKGTLTEDEQVTLQLYEGIIVCEMGKLEQGGQIFESALRTRSTAQLPIRVAPKVAKLFEATKTKVTEELATASKARADAPLAPSLTPNMQDPKASPLSVQAQPGGPRALTQRWYFWAGVGVVAAVAVGSIVWATSSRPFNPNELCDGVCDDVIGNQHPVGIRF
ncbi:hypothetical protein D187_002853 [Cystobacter fuscus DSM 2262]|uniref:Tetratricopeptide repeat domain protein n=1 Tax=Cystobacter fuscus (strain ATCC 25194 / DSM 2262 / NBRC 100088 / M29) TaxID=1242864 RepID=S9QRV6_CYSF2|nr:hypothetical protein [Cystobacter fuscus]EPX59363.1 hypothetical protein D187_002853 [Cystobacter fuscus DSM 2262]